MSRLVPAPQRVTTADATLTVLATLNTPSATAVQRYTGQVVARNTSTQENAVAWSCKKASGTCTLFGDVSVGLFQGDTALVNDAGTLAVPVVTASGSGCRISARGLASTPLTWSWNINSAVEV